MRGHGSARLAAGLVVTVLGAVACGFFAVKMAPKKTASPSTSDLARRAKQNLRESLREDRYDQLPENLRLLTAAYLENPRDWEVSFLLGMAHLWKIAERKREATSDPRITDHMILADKYLSEARRVNPRDFRIPGFEGSVKMALGSIHQDERIKREGYFILRDGMRRYPEFNFFTMSFVLSNAPRDSKQFAQAVDYAWKNVDVCAGKKVARNAPAIERLGQELRQAGSAEGSIPGGSSDRACRNPPTAPHNMEGFLLHMGDLLVKNGDADTARAVYALARTTPSYSRWPYSPVLEQRIAQAPERAAAFARGESLEMMFSSPHACVGCHATREQRASALLRC